MTANVRRVVCPGCGTVNRMPQTRPAGEAKCGACHRPLFSGQPVEVDEAGFERHVRSGDIPVLVDIWAPWCGPCRAMAPMFARAAAELEPEVRILKLNADTAPDVTRRLGVQGIPTLALLQGGRVLAQSAGFMDTAAIVRWTRAHLVQKAA